MKPDPTREPVIQSWQQSSIPGGWGVMVIVQGQEFYAHGNSPQQVVNNILTLTRVNKAAISKEEAWLLANKRWALVVPDRDMTKGKVHDIDEKQTARLIAEATSPSEYGPSAWGMLNLFGMAHPWDQARWEAAVEFIRILLDPDLSPSTGCSHCAYGMARWLKSNPANKVTSPVQAAKWVYNMHDKVNEALGKPRPSFNAMANLHHWVRQ